MLGDGVNDVPALKQARLAIAQGSGTQMARSVADLVLVSGEFGEVPPMVDEGRQILRNIQRVARLFVTQGDLHRLPRLVTSRIPSGVFPMLPRQFTLTSTLHDRHPRLLPRPRPLERAVAAGGLPARRSPASRSRPGSRPGIGILTAYLLARHAFDDRPDRRRAASPRRPSVVAGLAIVFALEDEPGTRRLVVGALCAAMALALLRRLRDPRRPRLLRNRHRRPASMVAAWAIGSAVTIVLLALALRVVALLDRRADAPA